MLLDGPLINLQSITHLFYLAVVFYFILNYSISNLLSDINYSSIIHLCHDDPTHPITLLFRMADIVHF